MVLYFVDDSSKDEMEGYARTHIYIHEYMGKEKKKDLNKHST